ncbi:MAG: glycine/betaine ABC transporter ATP-binding protein [Henriciella sp.]|uniref:ATP-binding cassette domain-containing protein n=1 Tax=Henriciella sp. TaxID=1968823 RepID=UPI000C0D84C7|nr:ATP-binding cassette domain-containing protein [Henriciella sp.]MAN72838.1 glycine/betaine ABC transporter ATP-binding protein [Henriciella sp.]MBF35316.1 glycine/betaine ABC transporter ATP-binding protein [Hyphomonadaceae bacterium]PHR74958.1 MAG: glycine/betaine ABC transporter ATP-binding protein [Henriciella sp.]
MSFDLASGETLALIGHSGCGKTTTLKMLNRLIEPDEGEVRLGGLNAHDMPAHEWRRRIGFVIQSAGLFPHRTVRENVLVTPRLLGWADARQERKLRELLSMVGLPAETYAERYPAALSGGERQRVGLARALAGEPDIILMDEPFAALDPLTRTGLIDDIARLKSELGFASVLVTHDFAEALRLGDRVAVMDGGRIIQKGAPAELIASPANDTVRDLLAAPRQLAETVGKAFGDQGG